MKIFSCLLTALLVVAPLATLARAQHIHSVPHTSTHLDTFRHGNHYHTVPHTTTHYHNYLHNGPDYLPYSSGYRSYMPSYSSYYYPGYSSYSGYSINPYALTPSLNYPSAIAPSLNLGGGGVVAAPPAMAGAAIAANKIPAGAAAANRPAGAGGSITLINPADSGGPIAYAVNTFTYTMQPGETQTLPLDRDWTIRFENGMGKQLTYRLNQGKYRFTVTADAGWNILHVADNVAPPAPSPAVSF
jgi:hypothetical protein